MTSRTRERICKRMETEPGWYKTPLEEKRPGEQREASFGEVCLLVCRLRLARLWCLESRVGIYRRNTHTSRRARRVAPVGSAACQLSNLVSICHGARFCSQRRGWSLLPPSSSRAPQVIAPPVAFDTPRRNEALARYIQP